MTFSSVAPSWSVLFLFRCEGQLHGVHIGPLSSARLRCSNFAKAVVVVGSGFLWIIWMTLARYPFAITLVPLRNHLLLHDVLR